ncbi:MAG: hypothetical protein FJX29_07520 [Alphaproteobacteria bacterium]|nr:hypothetical protein [Alphaproteobacteria bacterium]
MRLVSPNINSWRFRLAGNAPWIAALFIIAGLVHILSILAMPRLAERDAYARLQARAPLNQLQLISNPPGPDHLPYEDPATELAICRFDLTQEPLRLRGDLAGSGLVLFSFRDRYGRAFFAMTDRGNSRGQLDVIVATRAQLDAISAEDGEDETPSELRLPARQPDGFVLIRALALEPGRVEAARQLLQSISCASEKPAAQ